MWIRVAEDPCICKWNWTIWGTHDESGGPCFPAWMESRRIQKITRGMKACAYEGPRSGIACTGLTSRWCPNFISWMTHCLNDCSQYAGWQTKDLKRIPSDPRLPTRSLHAWNRRYLKRRRTPRTGFSGPTIQSGQNGIPVRICDYGNPVIAWTLDMYLV